MDHPSQKPRAAAEARSLPEPDMNKPQPIKHAMWFYPETKAMLAHIKLKTGLSGSQVIRHLVAAYAAGAEIPPLPVIGVMSEAEAYMDDLRTSGLGSH